MKKILSLVLAVALLLGLTACGKNNKESSESSGGGAKGGDDVYVSVIGRGYGSEWMSELAESYERETGIKVYVNDDPNLMSSLTQKMEINRNLDDLYFTWNNEWVTWALQDKMEDLTSMFSEKVDGVSINDRLRDDDMRALGSYEGSKYCAPLPYSPTGFVYNKDYLDIIPSKGEYVKGTFPDTWQGLLDLCDSINEMDNLLKNGTKVKPFAYGGSVNDFNHIFKPLWGSVDPTGFKNYWNYDNLAGPSKSVWVNEGVATTLDLIYDLFNPKKDAKGVGYADNCVAGVTGMTNLEAQQNFLNGYCVFCVTGGWFENEMKGSIDENTFEYHFAPIPKVNGNEKTAVGINLPGEYFFVPSAAVNASGAKDFLRYIYREENLIKIQNYLQIPLVFDLDMDKINLTEWGMDCAQAINQSDRFYGGSTTKVYYSGALNQFFKHDTTLLNNIATNKYQRGSFLAGALEANYNTTSTNWQDYVGKVV